MRSAIIALALAGFGQIATAQEFQTPVEADWGLLEIGIASQAGSTAEYRMIIFERDGKVAVCGAGVYTNSSLSRGMRLAMRRASVGMNGRTVLRNLSFFPIYGRSAPLVGRMAACKVSRSDMVPGADFDIDLPQRVSF